MKKVIILVVGLSLLVAGTAFAGVSGSVHDLRATYSLTEICNPCHTPHNATQQSLGPLWDHDASAAGYTEYVSQPGSDLDMTPNVGPESEICLDCHDGTVRTDAFGGGAGTGTLSGATYADLGTDLRDDHPIGSYTSAIATADGELADPSSTAEVTSGGMPLFSGMMECPTCHDVHNTDSTGADLLYQDNNGSKACLVCHVK
jgi:predicted CXXCH cytochrome family protein